MDYELAKKLKDAGFPQTGLSQCTHDIHGGIKDCQCQVEDFAFIPSLESLVEACGEKLGEMESVTVQFYPKKQVAYAYIKINEASSGPTPLIAVANLWLKLNEIH